MRTLRSFFNFQNSETRFVWISLILFLLASLIPIQFHPFWDDSIFFDRHLTQELSNPLLLWLRGSEFTKAWPLTYSLVWLNFKSGLNPLISFKFLSLLCHIVNSCLILRILKIHFSKNFRFGYVLFLFHPAFVFNLSWAFQFTNSLSILMILILLHCLLSARRYLNFSLVLLALLYFLALAVKPWAAALCAFPMLLRTSKFRMNLSWVKAGVLTAFMLASSLYFYSLTQVGIRTYKNERIDSQSVFYEKKMTVEKPILTELVDPPPIESLNLANRFIVLSLYAGETSYFYARTFFCPSRIWIFSEYPKQFRAQTILGIAFLLILILTILRLVIFKSHLNKNSMAPIGLGSFFILMSWASVSGLTYIPHMKFSLVSPHWLTFQIIGYVFLSVGLIDYLKTKIQGPQQKIYFERALQIYLIFIIFSYVDLNWRFNHNRRQYLIENLNKNPNSQILPALILQESQMPASDSNLF